MNNFLDSTVLPGDNLPKHEHKKMTIVLFLVLIVALSILAWFMVYGGPKTKVDIPFTDTANNQQDANAETLARLKTYEVPMTDAQKTSALKELSKYSVTLTDEQKAQKLAELENYANKK